MVICTFVAPVSPVSRCQSASVWAVEILFVIAWYFFAWVQKKGVPFPVAKVYQVGLPLPLQQRRGGNTPLYIQLWA
jgi:hypothetical protein